jgi:serine/threonine-protein kinase
VHRDLKPETVILVDKDGDADFVKILDFGIAKLTDESGKNPLTKVGVVLGTLDYMAPEQALGKTVDARTDLYALGVVTYEMLSGACPYEGESAAAILQLQLTKPPPSFAQRVPGLVVPPAVEALVMRLLAKDQKDRPAFATAVAAQLAELLVALPSEAAAARPAPGSPMHHRPTFLPNDPLPQFTFPPNVEQSRKLAAEVQAALAAQPPAPRPDDPPLPGAVTGAPAPMISPVQGAPLDVTSPARESEAEAGGFPAKARAGAALAAEIVFAWIDDNRRVLPRFIRRPLLRVPTPAIAAALLVLSLLAIWLLVSLLS